MLVLDENLPEDQCERLRSWRFRFRVIGVDVGSWGTDDENLLPILHHLPRPTFFTLDQDFHRIGLLHRNYCLVWLDIPRRDSAEFIRRFLKHPTFNTQAKRMGIVARVHGGGVRFWKLKEHGAQTVPWHDA